MRHGRRRKKLGVKTHHRKALLRNLIRSLVIYKRIRTTVTKAKSASAMADKMVTIAKRGDLHARRLLISYLGCPATADRLIERIAPQFKGRQGGYTRVLKLGDFRPGDTADLALLEFTVPIEEPAKAKPKKVKKAKPEAAEEPKAEKRAKGVKEKESKAEDKAEAKKETSQPETKKESEKKGGFLGALRKFLKGDDTQ